MAEQVYNSEFTGEQIDEAIAWLQIHVNDQICGGAVSGTTIAVPDNPTYWFAPAGTYTCGSQTITIASGNLGIISYDGSQWLSESFYVGSVPIADNLTTNDGSKALSAKQGYLLKDMIDKVLLEGVNYDIDDTITDYNYKLDDPTAPTAPRNVTGWSCMKLEVKANEIISFTTFGGSTSARAYALTDVNRNILEVAAATSSAATYNVTTTQDGFLYINCKSDGYSTFAVTHYVNSLSALKEGQDEIKSDVDDIKEDLYKSQEFDSSDLDEGTLGQYWKLYDNGSLVDVAPTTPTAYTATGYWSCIPEPISIKEGDVVTISTAGGGRARAWAFTDTAKNLLTNDAEHYYVANDGENTLSRPETITAGRNGYLYVNFKLSGTDPSAFYVKVNNVVIESLVATVDTLSTTVDNLANSAAGVPRYRNNPLPLWKDELKVLAIANSFMVDGFTYMQEFIDASSIDNSKICFYGCFRSSGSLSLWDEIYNNNTALSSNSATCLKYAGGKDMGVSSSNTLKQILSKDWDVIVFQQVSTGSNKYPTFDPYLTKLVGYARENCTNQQVAIAWQMTWSYKDTHSVSGPHGEEGWAGICGAVKQMISKNGIDIIVPTGTAIQNARNSSINTNGDMTRDGAHLAYGVGRYVATSTWWQTLVAPVFNENVLANTATHAIAQDETGGDYAAVAVTSSNRAVCQKCAFYATINMWNITQV